MKSWVLLLLVVLVCLSTGASAKTSRASASKSKSKHKEVSDIHVLLDGIKARLLREKSEQESSVTDASADVKKEKASKAVLLKEVAALDTKISNTKAILSREKEELSTTVSRIDQELTLIEKIRIMLDHLNGKKVGLIKSHPAQSCAQLHALGVRKDGLYWLLPDEWDVKTAVKFNCKFTSEGGYTLVWSNLFKQSESNKASHALTWKQATTAVQIIKGGHQSTKLNDFTTFTGIGRWAALAPSGKLRYEWAKSRSATVATEITECDYKFEGAKFIRRLYNCRSLKGSTIWQYAHNNNRAFSTYNSDNDAYGGNCAKSYQGPYWYGACWSGNIHGHANHGAYYRSSSAAWEGNGWYWIR